MSQRYIVTMSVKELGVGGERIDDWLAPILYLAPVLIFLLKVGWRVAEKVRVSDSCHSLCQTAAVIRTIHYSPGPAGQLCSLSGHFPNTSHHHHDHTTQ